MQKSPSAFRTISEVGEILGVPAHVLRFWESKFSQIKPVKRGGGRRYYRPEDVALIRGIQCLLYEDGMTIKGAQKVLRERGVKAIIAMGNELLQSGKAAKEAAPATETPPAPKTSQPSELRRLYTRLLALRESMLAEI